MRIAFLNVYQDKVFRGAETFVSELSRMLSKKHEVEIISKVNYFKIFKNNYDIIIPTNGRFQAFLVRILTWLRGKKMLVSGQSGAGLDDRLNLYAFPDCFVALTNFQKEWAKKVNPFIKIEKIQNGVDLNKFEVRGIKEKSKTKTILCVSALEKSKRQDLLIKAVSKMDNVNLLLIGKGSQEKYLTNLGNKLLKDRFEIKSFKHADMPAIYKKADLFSFPTVPWESFGIVLVEAMASGLPVVCTDDPIRREIVGSAGLFVDPTDTVAYTNALKKALNADWKDLPRKQAEKFSWDEIAKKYDNIIKLL